MKQFIFLFAFLFSLVFLSTSAFAQNADKPISNEEYRARKEALSLKYGADAGNHIEELKAPIVAKNPLITKEDLLKAAGKNYDKFGELVGKPIALLKMIQGEPFIWRNAEYKAADDETRDYVDRHSDMIHIED